MTLLVARQCRLLEAPHGAVGALRRLQRPAVTIAVRSYQYEPKAFRRSGSFHKKLDLTEYRKHQAEHRRQLSESSYFLTPKYEESEIIPVNSAILIPASVAAVVSLPAVLVWPVLIPIETGTFRRKARNRRLDTPLQAKSCRLPRYSIVRAMAPQRRHLPEKGPQQAVQEPHRLAAEGARHLRCCRQAARRGSCRARRRALCCSRRTQVSRTEPTGQ